MKAENIQTLRSRKQKCFQIEADHIRHDEECTASTHEQAEATTETTTCQALVNDEFRQHGAAHRNRKINPCHRNSILMKSQSMPAATMNYHLQKTRSAAEQTESLHFTKRRSKSGPGEPSRPYYCVRTSRSENRKI
mmetsp:Transcript_8828/g.16154  ORF Transcript_8828/g.16154 Transcript_8828/m.16154 type:complete len:136 (+) Transcript_8828:612-1019(+)